MLGAIIVIVLAIIAILVVGAPLWLLVLWGVGAMIERRRRAGDAARDPRAREWQVLGQVCSKCGRRLVPALATCPNCGADLE